MAQKKNNMKKPLIILGVLAVAALLGFLIFDEVQSGNYLKALNAAAANTKAIESGSSVGYTYNYTEGDRDHASEVVRRSNFLRAEEGITFQESAGNEDGSTLISNVFLHPGEYFFLGEDGKWERTEMTEALDARPYSIATPSNEVSSAQFKRIKKTEVDGQEAYEIIYNHQWIANAYQGNGGKPVSGSAVYVISQDGETPYVSKTIQTLKIRATDEEGNQSIQVVEEISEITKGVTADGGDVKEALDKFYEENIKDNYIEAADAQKEESTEDSSEEELTVGSSEE